MKNKIKSYKQFQKLWKNGIYGFFRENELDENFVERKADKLLDEFEYFYQKFSYDFLEKFVDQINFHRISELYSEERWEDLLKLKKQWNWNKIINDRKQYISKEQFFHILPFIENQSLSLPTKYLSDMGVVKVLKDKISFHSIPIKFLNQELAEIFMDCNPDGKFWHHVSLIQDRLSPEFKNKYADSLLPIFRFDLSERIEMHEDSHFYATGKTQEEAESRMWDGLGFEYKHNLEFCDSYGREIQEVHELESKEDFDSLEEELELQNLISKLQTNYSFLDFQFLSYRSLED